MFEALNPAVASLSDRGLRPVGSGEGMEYEESRTAHASWAL